MQGVTEQLKTKNQMVWVGKMNSIRNAAIEVVNKEIIFTRNNISCNDGRIYYLLSWKNHWRYI